MAGLAYVVFSYDELACRVARAGCDVVMGVGGVISMLALVVATLGVIIVHRVWIRPVSQTGTSGWSAGWGVLFAVGAAVAVTRLPTHTCPDGFQLDSFFALCVRGGERLPATSHLVEKGLLAVAAVGLGLVLARVRWIPSIVATALTVVAWVGGMGLLLIDTMAREFLPG